MRWSRLLRVPHLSTANPTRPMLVYVPVNDAELAQYAETVTYFRQQRRREGERQMVAVHGRDSAPLTRGVGRTETLYLLVHGCESTSNKVGGVTGKTKGWFGKEKDQIEYLTAPQLADRMIADGVPSHLGDLRMMVCWAGRSQKKNEIPFAGQLCSALKGKGFNRIIVTGYIGAVLMAPSTKNLIIQTDDGPAKPSMAIRADGREILDGFVNTNDQGQSLFDMMKGGNLNDVFSKTVWY